jgi:hypothetical protein
VFIGVKILISYIDAWNRKALHLTTDQKGIGLNYLDITILESDIEEMT